MCTARTAVGTKLTFAFEILMTAVSLKRTSVVQRMRSSKRIPARPRLEATSNFLATVSHNATDGARHIAQFVATVKEG